MEWQSARGEFVQLCVEDDGPGIAPDILDRIFEPFFTTKDTGKGSGMGLASVHGIVHELGGHIVVDTEPGRGTRFCVLLPALAVEPRRTDRRAATHEKSQPRAFARCSRNRSSRSFFSDCCKPTCRRGKLCRIPRGDS